MAILEATDLTKHFGALYAVDAVSFSLGQGEILGLIGPNGAGKTTLFNMIIGLLRPDSGQVTLQGREITGLRPHKICRLGVAKTSQIMQPFRALTVFENVLVAALHGGGLSMTDASKKTSEVVAFVGLSDRADLSAASLTVPDRRRLELARALAVDPKVLLLDENMAGLNPHEIDAALELLREIRDSGTSIIVVEHIMRAVMGISDRIVVLNYGEKIAEGTPKEVGENQLVIEAYLGKKTASTAI